MPYVFRSYFLLEIWRLSTPVVRRPETSALFQASEFLRRLLFPPCMLAFLTFNGPKLTTPVEGEPVQTENESRTVEVESIMDFILKVKRI